MDIQAVDKEDREVEQSMMEEEGNRQSRAAGPAEAERLADLVE